MFIWLGVVFVYIVCANGCYKLSEEIFEHRGVQTSKFERVVVGAIWPLLVLGGLFQKGIQK